MKKEFKKGDKVFDILFGWGVIEQEHIKDNYCIRVQFKCNSGLYAKDGRFLLDANPTLSHKEYSMESNEFPRIIEVQSNRRRQWVKRVAIAIQNKIAITWINAETIEESKQETKSTDWKYWREVLEEEIVELTFQEISEGKGVGIPPHLIRIKK